MSQTSCPHCGSTNSIETAGQRYCADCGQLIMNKEVKKKADKKTKAIAQKAPTTKPRKTAPPLNLKAIEQSRGTKAPTRRRPGALDLRNTAAKPAAIRKAASKQVSPVKKVASVPAPKLTPKSVISEMPITEIKAPVSARKFRHKLALRDAFKSVVVAKTLGIALAATLITTICEVTFLQVFAKTGSYAVSETVKAGFVNNARLTTLMGHLGWAGLLGFIGYLVYHYGLAEIIFRTSRIFDRRSASSAQARRAALGSLAGMFVIDVVTWVFILITVVMVAGANLGFLGTKSLGISGVILAVVTNIIVAYIWLGLLAARHMATYAIVLGQVDVRRAYSTGWTLYNRQFGRITTGFILIAAVSFLLALPGTLLHNAIGTSSLLALVISTALTATTQAVLMIVGAIYFLRLYRYVIAREYDSELGHLLSGRQPHKSHVSRRLAVLGVIAIVWISTMVGLIVGASSVAQAFIR